MLKASRVASFKIVVVRTAARLGALFFLGMLGLDLLKNGIQNPMGDPTAFNQLLVLGIASAGLLLGWRWEGLGGGLGLVGTLAYGGINLAAHGTWWSGWMLWGFLGVSVLYLWLWRKMGG